MTDHKPKLILVCGLPGAGKTTAAKKLAEEMSGIRFCPDEWMQDLGISLRDGPFRDKLEQRFCKLSQELLQAGNTVILEYGFWNRKERDTLLKGARELGVGVELHYLDVPNDEIRARLEKRGMEADEEILAGKLEEWSAQFERPTADELKLYDNHPEV